MSTWFRTLTGVALLLIMLSGSGCTYYFGKSWMKKAPGREGSLSLPNTMRPVPYTPEQTVNNGKELLWHWAEKPLTDEVADSKITATRMVLARLMLKHEVPETNAFLMKMTVTGIGGSTHFMNKKGDYDFREIGLVGILHQFGDDTTVLYPETAKYITEVLLIETGSKPKTRTPHMLGLMRDTENHILMKEITRYLRNQWIFDHYDDDAQYDNSKNGMEQWFIKHLTHMNETGAYEFNANPYMGYTLSALLTLHSFTGSDTVKQMTQQVLDELNWEYALGTYNFRGYQPFRRRMERSSRTNLQNAPHTAMMLTWYYKYRNQPIKLEDIPGNYHQALNALVYEYQLPVQIYCEAVDTECAPPDGSRREYFVRIGHGVKASPEIYSAGTKFLISAGGVMRGKRSQIVPRPIVLLLNDTVKDLNNCFYIPASRKPNKWNQTGVYHKFAVGREPVHIPDNQLPKGKEAGWEVYDPYGDGMFYVVVYSRDDLGIMAIVNDWAHGDAKTLAHYMAVTNKPFDPRECFQMPYGPQICYDLDAKKKRWVIESVQGEEPLDRKFDKWPRHQGRYFTN